MIMVVPGCDGLYAIGYQLHRKVMALTVAMSNLLLECLVYGWSAAMDIVTGECLHVRQR